jgi:hypothetical protein
MSCYAFSPSQITSWHFRLTASCRICFCNKGDLTITNRFITAWLGVNIWRVAEWGELKAIPPQLAVVLSGDPSILT